MIRRSDLGIILLALSTLLYTGCARPWNIAHEGLEILADATGSTDQVVRSQMPADYDNAEEVVLQQVMDDAAAFQTCLAEAAELGANPGGCTQPRSVDEYMNDWRERVAPWVETFETLEAIRELLIGAEAALAVWRDLEEEPGEWDAICVGIGELQERLTAALTHLSELESVDITIPPQWDLVRPALQPVCTWVVAVVDSVAEDEEEAPDEKRDGVTRMEARP